MSDFPGVGRIIGRRRPEYGDSIFDLRCSACRATWCGEDGDPCEWCERTLQRLQADQRRMLLWPDWLSNDEGNPRFDELTEIDEAVWDRTRGQTRGTDSIQAWAGRLARCRPVGPDHQGRSPSGVRPGERTAPCLTNLTAPSTGSGPTK